MKISRRFPQDNDDVKNNVKNNKGGSRRFRRASTTTTSSCKTEPILKLRRHGSNGVKQSLTLYLSLLLLVLNVLPSATAFTLTKTRAFRSSSPARQAFLPLTKEPQQNFASSTTALGVTWFGGTAETEVNNSADSCELVAVRIERTSANSRRIFGEIVVPCQINQVWSILTDYNRLATHVPNLVESRVVSVQTPNQQPGDGQYRCRLFQKGAQKIVGFEFGASVTMDMVERFERTTVAAALANTDEATTPVARTIQFKCHDSFFFSEFDGQWKAVEQVNPATGTVETVLSYVVDVRPKGPVPVAALEWRIREDVPTNLRAVKSAALLQQERAALQKRKKRAAAALPDAHEQGESLTAYKTNTASPVRKNGAATTTPTTVATTATTSPYRSNDLSLTPRQRQEQLEAAAAARRALRKPSISPFAKAATPPPRKQQRAAQQQQLQQQQQQQLQQQQQQQQRTAPRRMAKIKVDWDDNETLGAYLKRP